jgi:hypothetical protein
MLHSLIVARDAFTYRTKDGLDLVLRVTKDEVAGQSIAFSAGHASPCARPESCCGSMPAHNQPLAVHNRQPKRKEQMPLSIYPPGFVSMYPPGYTNSLIQSDHWYAVVYRVERCSLARCPTC